MTSILLNHLHQYEHLRERLQEEFPLIDDETLSDTLEGLSTLPEALAAVTRSYLDDVTLTAALDLRIKKCKRGALGSSSGPIASAVSSPM